ncbi:hypothetical protein RFI_02388, partial [Reticulomyxa filosa]
IAEIKRLNRKSVLQAEEADEWHPSELALVEQEMTKQIESLVDQQISKIKTKQEWQTELERRALAADFADINNALKWDEYEVAYWLSTIGYEEYMQVFFQNKIRGDMLLYDLTAEFLQKDLRIRGLHVNTLLRAIQELKGKVTRKLEISEWMECRIPSNEQKTKLALLAQLKTMEDQWQQEKQSLVEQLQTTEKQLKLSQNQCEKFQQELVHWTEKYQAAQEQHRSRMDQLTASSSEQVLKYTEKLHELVKDYEFRLKEKDEQRSIEIQTVKNTLESTLRESLEAKLRIQISTEYDHKFSEERKKIQEELEQRMKSKFDTDHENESNGSENGESKHINDKPRTSSKFETLSVSRPLNSEFGSTALSNLITSLMEQKENNSEFAKPVTLISCFLICFVTNYFYAKKKKKKKGKLLELDV